MGFTALDRVLYGSGNSPHIVKFKDKSSSFLWLKCLTFGNIMEQIFPTFFFNQHDFYSFIDIFIFIFGSG